MTDSANQRAITSSAHQLRTSEWISMRVRVLAGLTVLVAFTLIAILGTERAQAAPVPLGAATSFAILGGTTVTNTGPTIINGNLGLSPGSSVTGFPPGTVNGNMHVANAFAGNAQLSLVAAYNNAFGQPVNQTVGTELGGTTRRPGVYDTAAGELQITGTLTLDARGNPNATFVFKAASTLVTASTSRVRLINGAQACNVFWQVGSSATLGTNSSFQGNILALTTISANTGATVRGRLLARNGAVNLDSNTVTRSRCDTRAPTVPTPRPPVLCVNSDFNLRVTGSDPLGFRRVDVQLGGKRILRFQPNGRSFSRNVRIPAAGLASARHRITVTAVDLAGNTRVKRVSFGRCARPVVSFTG